MHRFEIWAPFATRMSVKAGSSVLPMSGPDEGDWWKLDVETAGKGTDYGFLVDEDPKPYPDPRSQWQPNGVHGLSRIYNHTEFDWTDAHFQPTPLPGSIIYELHIGAFTTEGTFDAAISKLDYLIELGVTHVELMPVAAFDGRHGWGYDGVALSAVHEPYGGPDGLKQFVNAAHQRGLAVLLDVVYNHFGPSGNYTAKFGPYTVASHRTPWGGAVNLEAAGSYEVRRFFCDNALMWLRDFHLDGLRIDAVHAFVDRTAIHFLEQLAMEVEALQTLLKRSLVLIAESNLNDPRIVTPHDAGGFGIHAQWSDDFHHALYAVLCPRERQGYYVDFGSLSQLAKGLEQTFVFDGIYSQYRKRIHGKAPLGLSQNKFLGYIQNHDQVGNRAVGDRLSHTAGIDRAKIAAALVLTGPFVPMIFQGEEWAASTPFQYFADHADPELARAVSNGRRRDFASFGWDPASVPDPESPAAFINSKLKWEEVESPHHAEMIAWYRSLIHLRKSHPCLNDGTPGNARVTFSEQSKWLCMERGNISLLCNLGDEHRFSIPQGSRVLLALPASTQVEGGDISLPQDSVVILESPHRADR